MRWDAAYIGAVGMLVGKLRGAYEHIIETSLKDSWPMFEWIYLT